MKNKYRNSRKKLSSVTLLFMVSNWEFNGQVLTKVSKKNKWKKKKKMFLVVNKKRKKKKCCVLVRKNLMKLLIYWLKRRILYLMKKWERNSKKPVKKKNSNKNWNSLKKLYQLIQLLSSIYLSIKWQIHASM